MNSSLVNVVIPASDSNFTYGRSGRSLKKITIHHCAGVMSAESIGYLWQNPSRECSSHYGIGNDGRIGQYVDESNTAWTDSNWESNCTSVTIENSNSSCGGEWPISDVTLDSLIKLCADISLRNGLGFLYPGQNLTWHSMYAATTCPGDYLRSKMQYIADKANEIISGGGPTPEPTSDIVKQYQQWLNSQYGFNLEVDGKYGYDTNLKGVMALQIEYNNQWGASLVVDGIFGQATKSASPVLSIGVSGNITKNVQYMLEINGFSVGGYGCDGIYGISTSNAVADYQRSKGLVVDGLCGPETFYSLY